MYSVILEASAQEFFANVQPALAKKLARCFAILEELLVITPISNLLRITTPDATDIEWGIIGWFTILTRNNLK